LETNVLIGYVQEKQKEWIMEHGLYNIRIDKEITPEITGADYLLLYDKINDGIVQFWKSGLFKIKANPVIRSKDWLSGMDYPEPSKPEYFVYEIFVEIEDWSKNKIIEITFKEGEEKYRPITRVIPELII